jgi:hypothetical protein
MQMKQGANSIPTELLGTDKSDLKLQNIFQNIQSSSDLSDGLFYFLSPNGEKKVVR